MEFEGCPGSKMIDFRDKDEKEEESTAIIKSQLQQWPIQMHLISPTAPYYQGADVLLTSDCVAYALGGFHRDYLKGKSIGIACPKLDSNQDTYVEKIRALIDDAKINTMTVMTMEVPCCGGLLYIVKKASEKVSRKIPIKSIVVSIKGEILKDEWI